jgi:hypothetical protein
VQPPSPSSQNKPHVPRRGDTPMTYLVRQLLGQVEVVGDEPAVVLGPQLVKDASHKIRLVVNKLVEIAVEKAKKDGRAMVRESESEAIEEALVATSKQNAADVTVQDLLTLAQQHRSIESLKRFAQDQMAVVGEQKNTIVKLQQQVEENLVVISEQRSEMELLRQCMRPSTAVQGSNATVKNLVRQLDGGIAMVQRQKKEIESLKAKLRKHARKEELDRIAAAAGGEKPESQTHATEEEIRQSRPAIAAGLVANLDTHLEIHRLKNEVRDLEESLSQEKRQGEQCIRAYMRAAVHALKVRSLNDNE